MSSIGSPPGGTITAASVASDDKIPFVDTSVGALDTANKTITVAESQLLYGMGIVASKSADYTLALSDAFTTLYRPNSDSTARTWTIPLNSSVAFPVGTRIRVINDGSAGNVSLATASGTIVVMIAGKGLSSGGVTVPAGSAGTLTKTGTDRWAFEGDANLAILYAYTPPLDAVTANYQLALGVRKLRLGYSGSCMKVRRGSDNTVLDIGFGPSGYLDTTALTNFVGSGDGFIDTWYDQSTIGNNVQQTTTTNQPKIVASGTLQTRNSLASVIFNGTSSRMPMALSASDRTMIVVAGRSSASSVRTIIGGGVGAYAVYFQTNNAFEVARQNSATNFNSGASTVTQALHTFGFTGGSSGSQTGSIETTEYTAGTGGATGSAGGFGGTSDIGYSSANSGAWFDEGISELILTSAQMTLANRQILRDNARAYFGTT